MPIEEISRAAQACFENSPTIVLGSGASIPYDLPSMGQLSEYLREQLEPGSSEEAEAWKSVTASLYSGAHLEGALEGKNLPNSLLTKIVRLTWNCVAERDFRSFRMNVAAPYPYPLGRLLEGLFRSTAKDIDLITTNYDRVVEYACNAANLVYDTGFAPGYLHAWNAGSRATWALNGRPVRTVRIWKVHGSLDWFEAPGDRVMGLPVFEFPSADLTPLIVTPGLNKYERTHQDPFRTTIAGADKALRLANAFLTIGFGFRDQHIHPKIIQRCREKNVPVVVLAKSLTDEAKEFLSLRAGNRYLAIEEHELGSIAYTSQNPDGEVVEGRDIWSVAGFLGLIV